MQLKKRIFVFGSYVHVVLVEGSKTFFLASGLHVAELGYDFGSLIDGVRKREK